MSKSLELTPIQTVACCSPLGLEPLSAEQADRIVVLLKALSDPTRLRLMSLIAATDELCVCDLMGPFGVSQPNISHHLKVLHESGLLDREKRGTWVFYKARPAAMAALGSLFTTNLTNEEQA